MEKSLLKDSVRQIKNTFKRFLSIVAIVLLGVGFFAGITATSPDMKDTIDTYFDDENVMDIEVISTLGLTDEDIEALKQVDGTKDVVGTYSIDATFSNDKKEYVVKIESMPDTINNVILKEGSLPQNADECVVESSLLTMTGYKIGDYITLNPQKIESSTSLGDIDINNEEDSNDNNSSNEESDSNNDSTVKNKKVKIVGMVQSPLYISRSRGSSKLGAGSVNFYMYMPKENFNMDVYTVAYITADGAKNLKTYKDEYLKKIDEVKDNIDAISDERKQARYNSIVNTAQSKLDDAQKEYDEQKQKAEDELQDAQNKIDDGKAKIEAGERELANARRQADTEFANAEKKLEDAEAQLSSAKSEFETKKQETEAQLEEAQKNVDSLNQIKTNYDNLVTQKQTVESQIKQIEETLKILNQNPEVNAEKITELTTNKTALEAGLSQINAGISQIETALSSQGIKAENLSQTISSINSQIEQGKQELAKAENTINENEKELESQKKKLAQTKTSTYKTIKSNEQKLENSKKEIEENEQKLADARKETQEKLDEAQEKLNDAKTQIAKIEKPSWYILDRNSNYGYAEYIQDTDRVANLAKAFPIVFFLVAALISLTSMSRMIEEQRVQIGTLKALGYNKIQISFKYLIYAFLATMIGGVVGMIIGFKLIPSIIIMMTSFTRIIVVFSFLKNALGAQQSIPNQILVGIALVLTIFIMSPVVDKINKEAIQPYREEKITFQEGIEKAQIPMKEFLLKQTRDEDIKLFLDSARIDKNDATRENLPLQVLVPAFAISELKTAFQIGFLIYLPFLLIDLVVSSALMSMGMFMLPPAMISLPFKLLLFIMVDGWNLLIKSLILSFN